MSNPVLDVLGLVTHVGQVTRSIQGIGGLPEAENVGERYEISADVLYAEATTFMQAFVASGASAAEHVRPHWINARKLTAGDYALADGLVDPDALTSEERARRWLVLETARLWFTAELHNAIGKCYMELRIIPGALDWRL